MSSLEGLKFNIDAQVVKGGSSSVNTLATSLEKLANATSRLTEGASAIERIGTSVNSLSSVDVSGIEKLSQAIDKISSMKFNKGNLAKFGEATKGVGEAFGNLSAVNDISVGSISDLSRMAESLAKFGEAVKTVKISDTTMGNLLQFGQYLKVTMDSIAQIPDEAIAKIERIGSAMANMPNTGGLARAVRAMSSTATSGTRDTGTNTHSAGSDSGGRTNAGDESANVNANLQKSTSLLSNLRYMFSGLGDVIRSKAVSPVKNLASSIGKLGSSIGRILMYRAIRSVLKSLTSGIKTGMDNLYQFSALCGGQFKSSMDSLASSFLYLKNSAGAMASPLINAVAPAIQYVINQLVYLLNVANQVFAILTGASSVTIAKRSATDYAKTVGGAAKGASGAAKELKRTILGFDELNVLNDNSGGGGGGGGGAGAGGLNYADMFETVGIDGAIKSWVDRLKEAFATNSGWVEIGEELGAKVNGLVDGIDWSGIGNKIGTCINGAIQLAYGFLTGVNFINLGKRIAELLNGGMDQIDGEYIGRLFIKKFTVALDFLIGLIENLNWGRVGNIIGSCISGIFKETNKWLSETDFVALGESIMNGIIDFVVNFPVVDIVSGFVEMFNRVQVALMEVVFGVGKALGVKLLDGLIDLGAMSKILGWIRKIGEKIEKALSYLGIEVDITGTIDEIQSEIDQYEIERKTGANSLTATVTDVDTNVRNACEKVAQASNLSNLTGTVTKLGIGAVTVGNSTASGSGIGATAAFSMGLSNLVAKVENVQVNKKLSSKDITDGGSLTATAKVKGEKIGTWKGKTFNEWTGSAGNHIAAISLSKSKWTTFDSWSGVDGVHTATVGLKNKSSKSFDAQMGIAGTHTAKVAIQKSGWSSIRDFIPKSVSVTIDLVKGNWETIKKFFGLSRGGVIGANGGVKLFANGGYINGNAYGNFAGIPRYGNGTLRAGTAFIAGERGEEIVGHINGRTEVLNRSQMAEVMYSAITSGMQTMSGYWKSIDATLVTCTNAVISNMGNTGEDNSVEDDIYYGVYRANEAQNQLLRQQNDLLRQLLDKDVVATISTSDINSAQRRRNIRNGVSASYV